MPIVGPGNTAPQKGARPLLGSQLPLHPACPRPPRLASPQPRLLPAAAQPAAMRPEGEVLGAGTQSQLRFGGGCSSCHRQRYQWVQRARVQGVGQRPWARNGLCPSPTNLCPGLSLGRLLSKRHPGSEPRDGDARSGGLCQRTCAAPPSQASAHTLPVTSVWTPPSQAPGEVPS